MMEMSSLKNSLRRAVFLDRDGVLNEVVVINGLPQSPTSLADLRIVRDAPSSLARLKAAGFLLICVTNQPNVARGIQSRETIAAIHAKLLEELPLDDLFVCYHDDANGCDCRKPAPGLLLQGAARYGIDLSASYMVGDRWRDIVAGHRAGCRTVWIDYGYNDHWIGFPPHHTVTTLADATVLILSLTDSQSNR